MKISALSGRLISPDSRREAGLINRPESAEIFMAVVADCEYHFLILDGLRVESRKLNTIKHIGWLRKFSKIYDEKLARLHPKSYHSHLRVCGAFDRH